MLYNIIIAPIQLLLEVFYKIIYTITDSKGISVISLSFIVTIATLPLYMIAESWQEKERKIQEKLKIGTERIKQTFKGDEQYMILNTYYKQNHYHPIMGLRSSFSLLIQIPFFIAAYNFISSLTPLKGYSFLFIKDFGNPDASFKIGSFVINILPIAMTLINCIAGFIYSRGHSKNEQFQIYICALIFLVLLYNSPAGLVIYWTMNNILSLVKNVFYKIKNPKKVIYTLSCIIALFLLASVFTIFKNIDKIYRLIFIAISITTPFIPYIKNIITSFLSNNYKYFEKNQKNLFYTFLLSAITLVIITGITIPTILIESETELYCYIDNYKSPLYFMFVTLEKAIGIFLLWPICFYFLFSTNTKKALTLIFASMAICALINTFYFSGNYGSIEITLLFMEPQHFFPPINIFLMNLISNCLVICAIVIILNKKQIILTSLLTVIIFSLSFVSILNIKSIHNTFSKIPAPIEKEQIDPIFHLSKTEKNVILIMSDACMTTVLKDVFNSSPMITEKFKGFTYYQNTVTLGRQTMLGSPGLYGGYDYSPHSMIKYPEKTLQQKQNEALLTIPVLMHNAGFDVTVSDLPYENYLEQPISNMYKDTPYVKRYETHGNYSKLWYKRHGLQSYPQTSFKIKRNFICFSIFKILPTFLREFVYSHDYWLPYDPYDGARFFIDNYSELEFLPELFDFSNNSPSYTVIDNEFTHNDKFPFSDSFQNIDKLAIANSIRENDNNFKIHALAFYRLGLFFDYLRENNIYDNTRIIIVSDHGKNEINPDSHKKMPYSRFTATLLVKDFNCKNELIYDNTFMTNADTPYLATKDITSKIHPFTKKQLEVKDKGKYLYIANPERAESTRNRKNYKFNINDDEYLTLKASTPVGGYDIYNLSSWKKTEQINK